MEIVGLLFFLVIGIAGCAYPFMEERNVRFNKSDMMYSDGDNT